MKLIPKRKKGEFYRHMKIIQINATYGYASTGIIVKDIEHMLLRQSHETGVVYQSADVAPCNGYRMGNFLDWKLHALHTRFLGKQAYASKFETKRMLCWLKKQKPDIVHLHNLHSNYINLNMLLDFLAKEDIATVITLHDCWFFTGKCFHYVQSNCDKWKTECCHCPRNKMDVTSWFFDASQNVYRDKKRGFHKIPRLTVVPCSNWMEQQVRASFLQEKNIVRIYNGVDLDLFFPHETDLRTQYGLNEKFLIFGAANKWLALENKKLFTSFLAEMKEDERLVLFGCTDEMKEVLKAYNKVLALGYIKDRSIMSDWFATVDMFANVTLADTLPTVNMEAAACGTPVVTYAIGGSQELVIDEETGYIVEPGDEIAFLQAIAKVKSKRIERERCRLFAASSFDKAKNYLEYLKLYKKILSGEENA